MKIFSVLLASLLLVGCAEHKSGGERKSESPPGKPTADDGVTRSKSALESLNKAVEQNDAVAVGKACELVKQEGQSKQSVPLLIRGLKAGNQDVRETCSEQLIQLASTDKEPILALMDALEDQDPVVRRHAAIALGKIGPTAKEAAPALDQLQRNDVEKDDVRKAATAALQRINGLPVESK
jgi:HEAT repeat protein